MNINEVSKKIYDGHIDKILTEQTFWIGENADIEVVVNLHEYNGKKKLSALLKGKVIIETVAYNGSNNNVDILAAMESLVDDNEDYILDMVSSEGK